MIKKMLFGLCFLTLALATQAQIKSYQFKAGFNAQECDDMMVINNTFADTTNSYKTNNVLAQHQFKHHSASVGLDNAWSLWIRSDSTVIIALRGTTANSKSIVADFYCAMLPAVGEITLGEQDTLKYHLANEPKAAVHGGFLIGFAYLAKDIQPKLDSLYQSGYHNYIVTGHSQGGALCYYVSSWLWYLKKNGKYPSMGIKTYASASPKMGNMFFINDYDSVNHAEWAFSIVNSADVVTETPLTTQQLEEDMNTPNPFVSLYSKMNQLPFLKRIVLKNAFNKMKKGATKSSMAYQKYLGGYSEKIIKGMLPGIVLPKTVNTTYFLRPGVNISLQVNDRYKDFFKIYKSNLAHHGMKPYRFLLREYYTGLSNLE